ncbi:MAG: hypothetical protein M1536_05950 [Firmicutes bacterium]|nr:hypothetical protein [Bacillota bacterium]
MFQRLSLILLLVIILFCHSAFGDNHVSNSDQNEISSLIKKWHQAYEKKDINAVMDIEKDAIINFAKAHNLQVDQMQKGYKSSLEIMFDMKNFKMKPLVLKNLVFACSGEGVAVSRSTPPILESTLREKEDSASFKVNYVVFVKDSSGWRIKDFK